jgi:hypothetical protein
MEYSNPSLFARITFPRNAAIMETAKSEVWPPSQNGVYVPKCEVLEKKLA